MIGIYFLFSGFDGFMREFVFFFKDCVVVYDVIEDMVAVIIEFVSVGMYVMNCLLIFVYSKWD